MPIQRTVLVIDDDSNVREVLQMALEDCGYRVLCAPDGEVGISRALKEAPDLVIVDMMMPVVSGFVVLERLKQQHQFAVPIIMLTGNESDQQRLYAEFLGVDVYLNKPVRRTHLLEAVSRFCPLPIEAIVP